MIPEDIAQAIAGRTMVDAPRQLAVLRAIEQTKDLPGAFVECGVWRGGISMLAALAMQKTGNIRDIWLYDTFEGMPHATPEDGEGAEDALNKGSLAASLTDVREGMASTGYPASNIHYIKGMVEDTLPDNHPENIAILRLDTDWYRSTLAELKALCPLLVPGGAIIVDDYGHWQGCRKAVDEYFAANPPAPEWTWDDYTGVSGVKPNTSMSYPKERSE
jgi:O-methyltransferase